MSGATPPTAIHPTAVVDSSAELGAGVIVGPGAVIGPDVVLGDRCVVGAQAVVEGPAVFGTDNRIGPLSHLGGPPQDLKYEGGPTRLEVGDGNDFRSFCTVNRGTEHGGGVTRIGSRCLLMHYTHVAHDCILGDRVVMANSSNLGGHIVLENGVIMAALTAIHQFARVGRLAMVAAGGMVSKDVPPFALVQGDRARLHGLNTVGLRRAGVPAASRNALKAAMKILFTPGGVLAERVELLARDNTDPYVRELLEFVDRSSRGICT